MGYRQESVARQLCTRAARRTERQRAIRTITDIYKRYAAISANATDRRVRPAQRPRTAGLQ